MLSCSFLFILKQFAQIKVSAEKILGGRRQRKHQDRKIAPISLLPFYQWQVRGRTGPRAHLKETAPRALREK